MDIPLCRGTARILGTFGILALSWGGMPALARAAEFSVQENPLEFPVNSGESGESASVAPASCGADMSPNDGESDEDFRFRSRLVSMLRGEPMEAMIPFLAKRDRETAAFLVSIARKESSWGEHSPTKDGIDCYNYWGYKGEGSRGSGMGYACFANPEEAIGTVGDRLSELVHEHHLDSPERLIVWKCGSSCEGHSPESVAKWISDVKSVYSRLF